MEETIVVGAKSWKIRELLATEMEDLDFSDKKLSAKKVAQLSTGMSDEEYNSLTFRERLILMRAIDKLNGIGEDFTNPTQPESVA